MFTSFTSALCVAAIAAAACLATGVQAQDSRVADTQVKAQVDFDNPVQVRQFYDRLKTEARTVCDTAASYDHDYNAHPAKDCEHQALADAVRQVDRPQLSELHDRQAGQAPVQLSYNGRSR